MKKILEKIHKEVSRLNEINAKLKDDYERIESWEKDIESIELGLDEENMSSEDYTKKMEELNSEKQLVDEANKKYNEDVEDYIEKFDESRKQIIQDLAHEKDLIEKYMSEDLKNIDMKALKEEKKQLEDAMALSEISNVEFSNLDSEKQEEVFKAIESRRKNKKRLHEIIDIMSYNAIVSERNPQDVLDDINYVMEEVQNNFVQDKTFKLSSIEAKLDSKNKDKTNNQESENKKAQISNEEISKKIEENSKKIMGILSLMNQTKNDSIKNAEYSKQIKDLQLENQELRKTLNENKNQDLESNIDESKSQTNDNPTIKDDNIQQSDDAGNQPKDNNENIENRIKYIKKDIETYEKMMKKYENDPVKCENFKNQIKELEVEKRQLEDQLSGKTPEQKLAEAREALMNRIKQNKINILKLMKAMDKYKNDPEKYKACANKIKEIQNANKMMYEALFPHQQAKKNEQQSQQQSKNERVVNPEDIIYMGQKKENPQIKFDITTGYYTYTDEYGNSKEYNGFPEKDIMPKERQEQLMKDAMQRGLTKRQAKKIDYRIYLILLENNGELLRNYIDSFKSGKDFDKGFDIAYNLKKRNRKIVHDIGRKNERNVKSKANKAKKQGIAKVFKDKFRTKLAAIWGAIGISAIGGSAYIMLNANNPVNENNKKIEETQKDNEDNKINEDKSSDFKNSYKVNTNEQNSQDTEQSIQNQQEQETVVTVDGMIGSKEEIEESQNIVNEALNNYNKKKANNKQQKNDEKDNEYKGEAIGPEEVIGITELEDLSTKTQRDDSQRTISNDMQKVHFGKDDDASKKRLEKITLMDKNESVVEEDER